MLKTTLTRIAKMLLLKGGLIKFAAALAVLFMMITGTANAVTKTFEFGPGTPNSSSHFRTFYPPARAHVDILVNMDGHPGAAIPVVVEFFRADATSVGFTGPHGPLADSFSVNSKAVGIGSDGTSYISNFGCPNSWRVRVRTANNQPSPVRVSGTIHFLWGSVPTQDLDMVGGTQNMDPNVTATRIVKIRTTSGITTDIDHMGKFRIKAKWHTDLLQGGINFRRLLVRLRRPDGTIAASQLGYSQHAPANRTPKLNFTYNVTPQDAAQSGDWKLEIVNNSSARIVDFDIESGLDPSFIGSSFASTFSVSSCN